MYKCLYIVDIIVLLFLFYKGQIWRKLYVSGYYFVFPRLFYTRFYERPSLTVMYLVFGEKGTKTPAGKADRRDSWKTRGGLRRLDLTRRKAKCPKRKSTAKFRRVALNQATSPLLSGPLFLLEPVHLWYLPFADRDFDKLIKIFEKLLMFFCLLQEFFQTIVQHSFLLLGMG